MLPRSVDVLILGAGLAGLRAALSCLDCEPALRVLVVSASDAPSGSSFANQNNALGIHVCRCDAEREAYLREALALNRGAFLSPELLAIQAEEGEARLRDLIDLGLDFARAPGGELLGHSSCFSPHSRRAFVFTGLASAYACFKTRLQALGCRFAPGWLPAVIGTDLGMTVSRPAASPETSARPEIPESARAGVCPDAAIDLPGPSGLNAPWSTSVAGRPIDGEAPRATGALLVPRDGGDPVFVAARAVAAALGGPGRLFAHSMAGPGTPGYGHGLLLDAGASMGNLGFLQFMWGTTPGKSFWQPAALGAGGYGLVMPDGAHADFESILASRPNSPTSQSLAILRALCATRAGHCPFAYGLEDSALDLALAAGLDESGAVRLTQPDGAALHLAPMAHASNGGALIDENGQTSVQGLLACGECATGMHGANRLGGAMVLATQVFGHRAGRRAAYLASSADPCAGNADCLRNESRPGMPDDPDERTSSLGWLGTGLSRFAVLGGRPGHKAFASQVRQRLEDARDWRLRLSLRTALGILEGLPYGDD